MNLYVQVYDNDGASTIYYLPQNVVVLPGECDLELNMQKVIQIDTAFGTNIILNEGPYMKSIQEIQWISSLLNAQSLSDRFGLILSGFEPIFPQFFGPLSNYSGVIPVNF